MRGCPDDPRSHRRRRRPGNDLTEAEAAAVMEEMMSGEATPAQVRRCSSRCAQGRDRRRDHGHGARHAREGAARRRRRRRARRRQHRRRRASTRSTSRRPRRSSAPAPACASPSTATAASRRRRGAADVLEALGAKLELTPEQVKACIEKTGFGFMFAPSLPPGDALRRARRGARSASARSSTRSGR